MKNIIKVSNLFVSFDNEKVIEDLSFSIKEGEKVAVTGQSGKGKTTLLRVLAGFIPDFKGNISIFQKELNPENVRDIRSNIAWLPQETVLYFESTEKLFFAPFEFSVNKNMNPSELEVKNILNEFDLSYKLFKKKTDEISGGQKQRIILASCMLLKKKILFTDEPTSALDEKSKRKITDYVLNHKDLTVVASTHDEYWIKNSDRVIEL